MRCIKTYIPSLILSILLVFVILGGSAATIANINISASRFKATASDKNMSAKVYDALERSYREKSGATGIPAKVYTDSLSEEYLSSVVNEYIDAGFRALKDGKSFSPDIPKNPRLEESIDSFFNDYADDTGYVKDEAFEKKLAATKSDAYKNIGSSSDAFRFATLSDHGYMQKLSSIYRHRGTLIAALAAVFAVILLLIFVVNRKNIKAVLYWIGVSSLISGIIGTVPAAWLIADKYFDSFTIKQPQVFTAYTSTFYRITEAFMAAHIAIASIGVTMIVVYSVICGLGVKNQKNDTAQASAEEPSAEEVSE